MNKPLSLALLVGGLVLLGYGAGSDDSIGSSVSRFFTGTPTDRTLWLLLGGTIAAIMGAAGLLQVPRTESTLPRLTPNLQPPAPMLHYAVIFLLIALAAGILGFGLIEGTAAMIAKVLFLLFLVYLIVSLLRGRKA